MIVTRGININDKEKPWSELILSGKKTIETRNNHRLKSLIDKPVALIRTGKGKAMIVGFIKIHRPTIYISTNHFRADEHKHLVEPGSQFDMTKNIKYGYPITVLKKLDNPIPVHTKGISTRKIEPYEIY